MPDQERLLRTSEVAKLFHVSAKAVTRYADEEGLPSEWTPGGHRRYNREEALAWREAHLAKSAVRNKRAATVMHAGRTNGSES